MLRRVSTSFAAQTWGLFLSLADRLILVGVLMRVWGTDLYADWAILLAAANLISMGELGLNVYLGNAWQRAFAHKDEPVFQRFLSISLTIYLLLTLTLLVLAFIAVFAGDLGSRLSLNVIESGTAIQVLLVLLVAFALRIMRGSISQIYRGRGKFAAGTMINSLPSAVLIAAVVTAAWLGASPVQIALIYLFADSVLGLAIMVYDLKRRFPALRFAVASPKRTELADIVEHGKWYALLQAAPIAWLQVPVLMISALGLGGLGVVSFVVLRTLANFTRQIPEMLARSVGVETAGDFHLGDHERIARVFKVFGPFLSTLTGAFAGGLLLFAPAVVTLWTGQPEAYNPWVIFWLVAATLATAPVTPLRNVLTLGNEPRPVAIAQTAQLLIGLPLCFILARTYGIEGATAGLAAGEALAIGVLLPVLAHHHLGPKPWNYFIKCNIFFMMSALWAAFAAWAILSVAGAETPLQFIFSASLWAILGLVPAALTAIPADIRTRLLKRF